MEDIEKKIKEYEFAFLVREEAEGAAVVKLVEAHRGTITKEPNLKRITTAYKIHKESNVVFGFLRFQMEAEEVKKMEHALRIFPTIIRSLIMAHKAPKKSKGASFERPKTPYVPIAKVMERKPATAQASLSNEALEKKIEEILQ